MPYYRFITEEELAAIRHNGALLPQGHYLPYRLNEIVCVFESDDLVALFNRYGTALTEQREMGTGKKLIAIEVVGFAGRIEIDKSQNGGWPESRAIFDPIPLGQLRIIAQAIVEDVRGGQAVLGPLQFNLRNLT
ncbi:MAG TPA: hypothetical protein VN673_02225 [Clostridia bacterium]|nr:hypothetical protein [Clostridia bacterium]